MGAIGRLQQNAIKAWQALRARIALRRCTEVGALTRLHGGVIVSNAGTLRVGRKVKLYGSPVPIELVALRNAELSIGDGTSINRGVSICAQKSIRIGSNCGIGSDCLIFDTDFHTVGDQSRAIADASPVVIGDDVWLAARSVVLKGVTVGDGAVICAGSVVATNVAPYTMVGGVPARVIRTLTVSEGAPTAPAPGAVADRPTEQAKRVLSASGESPRLYHVGIVVASISAVGAGFAKSLSASWDGRIIHDPVQAARVSFLSLGATQPQVELVEPAGQDSPVARMAERGGGLHHLCFEVAELEAQVENCHATGAVLVRPPQPAVAFDNRRICWVFTRERLLVEYLEKSLLAQ